MVEILTGLLFAGAAWRLLRTPPSYPVVAFAVQAWFISVLVLSSAINLEFGILPDELTLAGIVQIALLSAAFPSLQPPSPVLHPNPHLQGLFFSLAGALAGGGIVFVLRVVGQFSLGREAVGMGVVKFVGLIGGVLGPRRGVWCLATAVALFVAYGVFRTFIGRRLGYVQVGPVLSASAVGWLFFPGGLIQLLQEGASLVRP